MKIFSYIIVIILAISFCGCESNAKPIVYDKTYSTIKNDIKLIHYLIRIRNFDEANRQLNKQLAVYNDNADLLLLKAWLKLQEYKFYESKQIFDKLSEMQSANIKNAKFNPMICAGLARIARLNGDYETAEAHIQDGLKQTKLLAVLWSELGFIKFHEQKYTEAETSFYRANLLDRTNVDALLYRYISMLYCGKPIDDIKQHWTAVTKSENCRSVFYMEHAKCLYELGNFDLCKTILKEGLERYKSNIYLNNFYAYFLYEQYAKSDAHDETLIDEALTHIEPCFRNSEHVEPEFVDTYLHLLEAKGELDKLNEILDTYYLLFPNSSELIPWLQKYRS